ncbi:MAG: UDP-N-acetylmuramate:L-alanyl-gamma-D-glutamyl-meso-diaminopimelate ligase [Verrucomicrobiota bacterium]
MKPSLFESLNHIHFIGICGTAMGSVAAMLKNQGFHVTGSDQSVYPPMSSYLHQKGIPIMQGFSPEHLEPAPDLVVIGNAVSRGNEELEAVMDRRLFYLSLPETLKFFFLRDTHNLVVSGTHGKTTTTSLLAWIFEAAGKNPSYMIGGIPGNFTEGCRHTGGDYWILEGDEYDTAFFDKRSKFLHYLPELLIINNLEFDHADIFGSLEEVMLSFSRLARIVPRSGMILVNADEPEALKVTRHAQSPILEIGFSENAGIRITDLETTVAGTSFTLIGHRFHLPMFGKHNVHNAAMVIVAAHNYHITLPEIEQALSQFKGIKRRMEVRAEINDITVIDDFAHHPTAIRETITALKTRYAGRRLWILFEPRSNTTRRNVFQHTLPEAFKGADRVVLTQIARAEQLQPEERLDIAQVLKDIQGGGTEAQLVEEPLNIPDAIRDELKAGDVVAFFSNGSFGGAIDALIENLQK